MDRCAAATSLRRALWAFQHPQAERGTVNILVLGDCSETTSFINSTLSAIDGEIRFPAAGGHFYECFRIAPHVSMWAGPSLAEASCFPEGRLEDMIRGAYRAGFDCQETPTARTPVISPNNRIDAVIFVLSVKDLEKPQALELFQHAKGIVDAKRQLPFVVAVSRLDVVVPIFAGAPSMMLTRLRECHPDLCAPIREKFFKVTHLEPHQFCPLMNYQSGTGTNPFQDEAILQVTANALRCVEGRAGKLQTPLQVLMQRWRV
ncbi:hypothetical protein PAPYR_8651 [Paratrimastix pyriformis]|uniref:Uncharacterized protein n=1 Tax=Paratrimastix pyriformis TaxID=342808 RepID=A0ABQ8UA77_9EUKA|nr:hypothetical protein PAPYR_8651 [Paratrimastix pyriformis]